MLRPKRNDSPVVLNLPKQSLEQVDIAVRERGVTLFAISAAERRAQSKPLPKL